MIRPSLRLSATAAASLVLLASLAACSNSDDDPASPPRVAGMVYAAPTGKRRLIITWAL